MANYTEHYQLHQWEPSDNFLRTDFNQDFARIDTGIRAAKAQAERLEREKAEISTGAYTGDNAASRTIHLGFRPRAVLVEMALGNRYGSNGGESISGGLAVDGWPVFYQDINGPCTPAIQIRYPGQPEPLLYELQRHQIPLFRGEIEHPPGHSPGGCFNMFRRKCR